MSQALHDEDVDNDSKAVAVLRVFSENSRAKNNPGLLRYLK